LDNNGKAHNRNSPYTGFYRQPIKFGKVSLKKKSFVTSCLHKTWQWKCN